MLCNNNNTRLIYRYILLSRCVYLGGKAAEGVRKKVLGDEQVYLFFITVVRMCFNNISQLCSLFCIKQINSHIYHTFNVIVVLMFACKLLHMSHGVPQLVNQILQLLARARKINPLYLFLTLLFVVYLCDE